MHLERHVTVDHDWVVGADGVLAGFEVGDVLTDTLESIWGTVWEGDLGSPEAELLSDGGFGAGKVERDVFLGSTTDHLVDWLSTDFAQQIPDGEIDDGQRGKRETWV